MEVDNDHVFGSLRAAVTVVSSIRGELGGQAEEMSEKELSKAARARQAGVRLRKKDDLKLLRLNSEAGLPQATDTRPSTSMHSSWHGRSVSALD